MKINRKKKIALALSGGGIKAAAFHIGVCLALKEKGFHFAGGQNTTGIEPPPSDKSNIIQLYVGSSAGAVISTILAAGYGVEALVQAFEVGQGLKSTSTAKEIGRLKPLTYKDIFAINGSNYIRFIPNALRRKSIVTGGLEALFKSKFKINGIFTTKGIERYLRENVLVDNNFSSLEAELFIVATQLNHSRKVVFGNFDKSTKSKSIKYANFSTISDAVAASGSLPPVFAPYGINNQKNKEIHFFDGEIRETLSTHVAADHGADLVISSYSVQPYHYTEEMGSLHNYGIPMIINQALYQVIQQKIEKHRDHQQTIKNIHKAIDGYFQQTGLPIEHKDKVLEIVRERANFRPEVDYLYIHPSPNNYELFFADHFSLNPNILKRIVKAGFKSTINVLRKHDI